MGSNNNQRQWVLAWRPFNPSGMFVHEIGDLSKGDNAIVAKYDITNAMRLTRQEAHFLLDTIKSMSELTFAKELVAVDLGDHRIDEGRGQSCSQ